MLEVVESWRNDYYNGSLQRDSETQREQAFNQDFFMRILGYESKPSKSYTFEPKSSTQTGEIPDARIGFLSGGAFSTVGVVELKSASANLDKPQFGQGKMSPVQQGFKYKPLYPGCRFVIISNFFEIRLYSDNIFDYESWTLDSLVDPADDYLDLRKFVTVLRARNLLPHASGFAGQLNPLLFGPRPINLHWKIRNSEPNPEMRPYFVKSDSDMDRPNRRGRTSGRLSS